jgi:hypothetical protein
MLAYKTFPCESKQRVGTCQLQPASLYHLLSVNCMVTFLCALSAETEAHTTLLYVCVSYHLCASDKQQSAVDPRVQHARSHVTISIHPFQHMLITGPESGALLFIRLRDERRAFYLAGDDAAFIPRVKN